VVGPVKPGPVRLGGWQPPATPLRRVASDQLVFDRRLEYRGEGREHFVDRGRAERSLPHLRQPEVIDVGDRDLVHRHPGEMGKQMLKAPLQVGLTSRRQASLAPPTFVFLAEDPGAGELLKARHRAASWR
jgi:hypothetical protein